MGVGTRETSTALGFLPILQRDRQYVETPLSSTATGLLAIVLVLLLAAGLLMWGAIGRRLLRGEPLVAWSLRPPVPWGGLEVALVVFLYLGGLIIFPAAVHQLRSTKTPQPLAAVATEAPDTQHQLVRLIRSSRDAATLALSVITAALLAPLCEEFVFRLVLQGWLEDRLRWLRLRARWLRRRGRGLVPLMVVALLFAGFHARGASAGPRPEVIRDYLSGAALAQLVTLLAGTAVLRYGAGATAADLGLRRATLRADVRLGLASFLALAPVLYGLQMALTLLLPKRIAADPISLVPFALVVGWLYLRTHRIVPSIVTHMALNATSLLLLWLAPEL